ncbi:hypothetical protein T265_10652 [Opisthorchis viverrini]|uniref:Uncharacterized protein n=1 Tax=Opisthorchis viverrini TaxID=6198 RepID=A0A074Z1P2_OPIVI|nr:hypothetical protein T265_10652 [Opisthorchis viverrini]KER20903.1 hypothetical protein T265_10652 [Opisthorchis viverrini]
MPLASLIAPPDEGVDRRATQCFSVPGGALPQAKFPALYEDMAISSQYEFTSDGGRIQKMVLLPSDLFASDAAQENVRRSDSGRVRGRKQQTSGSQLLIRTISN